MKSIRERDLEQAFLRAMNEIIASKEAYLIEENGDRVGGTEDIDVKLEELQQKLMRVVRNTGIDNKEYSNLATEIEGLQAYRQMVKGAEAEKVWRDRMREEFKSYLAARDGKLLDRFDG